MSLRVKMSILTFLPPKSGNFDNCFSLRQDDILWVPDQDPYYPTGWESFSNGMGSLGNKEEQTTTEKFLAESKTAICCSGSNFLALVRKTAGGSFSIQRIGNSNIHSNSGDTGSTKEDLISHTRTEELLGTASEPVWIKSLNHAIA